MQNNIVQSSLLQSYMQKAGINSQIGVNNSTNNNTTAINVAQKPDVFQKEGEEETEKGKIAKYALGASMGISVAAAIIASFRHKGGVFKAVKQIISKAKNTIVDGGKKTGETIKNSKVSAENLTEFQKGADNISNAKDSIIRHVLMKIPGYEKFDAWASGIYKKAALKTLNKTYSNAKNAVSLADDAVLEAAKKADVDKTTLERLTELVQKRRQGLSDFTSNEAIQSRISKIDDSIQRLDDDAWKTIKDIKDEGLMQGARKLSKEALAEARLKEAKRIQEELMLPYKNMGLSESEAQEYIELAGKILENSSVNNKTILKKAEKAFNKAFSKEKTDFFEKIRDINYGCAPSDILSTAGTIATLGLYTAQADTKEEKVGVTLTTGIPLAVSLGTTITMTTRMVGGAKALILGALTGFCANILGKQINKKYQEAKGIENVPKTIITLDDYANEAKEKADRFIHTA